MSKEGKIVDMFEEVDDQNCESAAQNHFAMSVKAKYSIASFAKRMEKILVNLSCLLSVFPIWQWNHGRKN